MKKKIVNFGIVGVGYWGPNYARILSGLDQVNLRWICDLNKEYLLKINKNFPAINTTTNLDDILKDDETNCIAVVTPPESHYSIAKRCLDGNKHLFIEKPLALKISQAQTLVKLAEKKKLIFGVDHTYKFNPAITKLKEIISKSDFGKIYYIYGLYNALGPIRREISALWDLSIHFLYVVNYLLDKRPICVSAIGGDFLQKNIEDVVFANFKYPNNIIFSLHTSWLDPSKTRQLVIVGSKKMVVFDDVASEGKLKIYDKFALVNQAKNFTNFNPIIHEGDIIIPKIENKEPLKEAILNFVNSVINNQKPFVSGTEGKDIIKILEFTQRSISNSGKIQFIK